MNLDKESWLRDLFDLYANDPDAVPEGFEEKFITDIAEKFEVDKSDIFISPKMWNILKRIGEQRYGMNWKEYQD